MQSLTAEELEGMVNVLGGPDAFKTKEKNPPKNAPSEVDTLEDLQQHLAAMRETSSKRYPAKTCSDPTLQQLLSIQSGHSDNLSSHPIQWYFPVHRCGCIS